MGVVRPFTVAVLLVLLVSLSFVAGMQYERAGHLRNTQRLADTIRHSVETLAAVRRPSDAGNAARPPEALVQEAYDNLKTQFVEDVQAAELQHRLARGAVQGMLASLHDPYTRVMDETEYSFFLRENAGQFEGIGCTLRMQKTTLDQKTMKRVGNTLCPFCGSTFQPEAWRVSVLQVIPRSPAAKAGLLPNDLILAVNNKNTEGMSLTEAATLIRGKKGSKVSLLIGRKGARKPITKIVTRDSLSIPDTEWKMLGGGMGYIKVNLFNEQSASRIGHTLRSMERRKARGLVLDLRNCQGGLLKGCVDVGRLFISKGPVVYIRERGRSLRGQPTSDSSTSPLLRVPMVVLVNSQTASAAEILAAALHERAGAKLVGVRTFGKGLVQTVIPLSDGAAMVITTARWYPTNGAAMRKTDRDWEGVEPDIRVTEPAWHTLDDLRGTSRDLQYSEGLKLLQTRLRRQADAEGSVLTRSEGPAVSKVEGTPAR